MKKSFIILNIISLFLVSCGNLSALKDSERVPASAGNSCHELMKEFMSKGSPTEELSKAIKVEVSQLEAEDFFKLFSNHQISDEDSELLRGIFLFTRDNQILRKSLLQEYHNQLNNLQSKKKDPNWDRFIYHQKKVSSYSKKVLRKNVANAAEKIRVFEKLYYGCKSQIKAKPSTADLAQAKKLTYALTFGAAGSTAITYTAVNWEQEKNSKWFNELYFTLGVSLVSNFIIGKYVLANPNLTPWKGRMPLTFLSVAANDVAISGAYGYLFGVSDTELEKKLQDLSKDPEAQKKLNELLVIAEENGLFEKYIEEAQFLFKDKVTGETVNQEDYQGKLTIDNVDLEASRELFMAALAEKEYQDKSGPLETGSTAVDRFSYNRIFNVLSIPSNIAIALLMNNQMCMSQDPKVGFAKAVTTYMAASLLFDALYFKGRREAINQ